MRVPLTSRWLLATAMVVTTLFCCCNSKATGRVMGLLLSGGYAASHAEAAGCCSGGGGDDEPTSPTDEDEPCDCRTRLTAKGMPDAKTVLDTAGAVPIAPVLLAWVEPGFPAVVRVAAPEGRAVLRPSMSLLRQHCALII